MRILRFLCVSSFLFVACLGLANAQAAPSAGERDGQHDWDQLFGTWKMHLHKRLHPLANSDEWVDFEAHDDFRRVWGGRANLDEFEADGPAGHIEGLTLRLYNPQTHLWSIYWANSALSGLEKPMIGKFNDGVGEFYDQELFHDRAIYVRFRWTNISGNGGDFTQSFSADGGKTWEPNWITTMARETPGQAKVAPNPDNHDGQHDFDFEFGNWTAHLRRRLHPLTGSDEWVEYDGTSNVQKIWNGRANLGEFNVKNASGGIEGLSLRLFDPKSHQWRIYWASAADGDLDPIPMAGGFKEGRGEFYSQELYNGRYIFVRFLFTDLQPDSFRLEQAFSNDGGKSWEPNWVVNFTRTSKPS